MRSLVIYKLIEHFKIIPEEGTLLFLSGKGKTLRKSRNTKLDLQIGTPWSASLNLQ